eukprot:TRINITY_DN345_c0_g1_i1.p1 TRINITY_DN345_c0_g1~~TRINITY_DN345_c0_g1_i1.p1  ORF type:complete len:213 (-),score=53.05 TRINITY_DN345_c0_g1_i1:283-921(-)
MALASLGIFSSLPYRTIFHPKPSLLLLRSKPSLSTNKTPISHQNPGLLYFAAPLLRATNFEETSTSLMAPFENVPDGAKTIEDEAKTIDDEAKNIEDEAKTIDYEAKIIEEAPIDQQIQPFEFLEKLNIKLNSEDTYSILIYGSSALVALWISSAIVGALDSIPLFPKLMEIIGFAFTIWFGYRYLIFKKNRDELLAKIEDLKQQIIGLTDD